MPRSESAKWLSAAPTWPKACGKKSSHCGGPSIAARPVPSARLFRNQSVQMKINFHRDLGSHWLPIERGRVEAPCLHRLYSFLVPNVGSTEDGAEDSPQATHQAATRLGLRRDPRCRRLHHGV